MTDFQRNYENDTLISKARELISATGMPAPHPRRPVIVGVSGGADSVALLSVMITLGYRCVAAHANFHLRGEESMRDEAHARDIAGRLGAICIEVKDFDIPARRDTRGGSVEMACRDTRYEWFHDLVEKYDALAIAVAHHAGDNTETMLLNLLRGSGVAGLRAMLPWVNGIMRPLLSASRRDIEQYLDAKQLDYITDSSNLTLDYRRNRLRNEIIPTMERHFPGAATGMRTTIANMRATERMLERYLDLLISSASRPDGSIALTPLSGDRIEEGVEALLKWSGKEGLNRSQAADILQRPEASGRRYPTPRGVEYVVDHGLLRIAESEETFSVNPFEIKTVCRSEFRPDRSASVAFFAPELLAKGALKWRRWQPGDRMRPFGMKGSRLVSDIMAEAGLTSDRRANLPLLLDAEGNIIFIPGVRTADLYRVMPHHSEIVKIILATR